MKAEDLDELELLLAKYTSWAGPPANSLDSALRRAAPELVRLARLGLEKQADDEAAARFQPTGE